MLLVEDLDDELPLSEDLLFPDEEPKIWDSSTNVISFTGNRAFFILDVPPAVLRRRPLRHLVIYANSPLVPVGSGGVDAGESVAVGLDFSQAYFLKGRKFKGVVGAVLSFRVGDLVQNGHFGWCVAVHAVVYFSWGGWDGMEWSGTARFVVTGT